MRDLPNTWTKAKVNELFRITYGKDFRKKNLNGLGNYPVYGANGIIALHDIFTHTESKLIIGCRGSVGKTRITKENSFITHNCLVLDNVNLVEKKFLKYAIDSTDLSETITGTSQPQITIENFEKLELPLAPLNEQKRIVEKLEKLFGKVEAVQLRLDKIPAILKRFRQAVLAAACSGRLTMDWRKVNSQPILSGDNFGEFGELPNTWSWKKVKDLASNEKGSIQSGPFGSNLLHSEFQSTGILAIGIDNVLEGKFSLGKEHRISTEKYEELKKYTAKPEDVLITVMATVGRCCVFPRNTGTAIITKHVYRISCEQTLINPYYLLNCLQGSIAVQQQVQAEIRGATRPGINGSILKEIVVPLPPTEEQKEIVRRIEELFKFADQIEARYRKARSYTDRISQSILAKAFRGELVPQDERDEPASVLLERIKTERTENSSEKSRKPKKKAVNQSNLFD